MVNFRSMNRMIRSAGRMSKLMTMKSTRYDPDTAEIISSAVDGLITMQEELKPMIETLDSSEQRMILNLRYLKGYNYPWIANRMNMSERNVYYLLKLARMALIERFPDAVELG